MNDTTNNPTEGSKPSGSSTVKGSTSASAQKKNVQSQSGRSIDFLLDIPLELTVEVGRRSMTMGELMEMAPGTVVELDHGAQDYLDIVANGKLIARGEAVVVGDRYGVRIMEVVGEDSFE